MKRIHRILVFFIVISLAVSAFPTSVFAEEALSINQTKNLVVGDSKPLVLTGAEPDEVIWTSGNPSVATVDAKGVVTGVATGTVTITASTNLNEDEIKKEYGKYAHIVLEGIREKSLKVDPVEFTEGFAEKLQEVMWKVEAAINKEGDFHSGYQRWQLMEQYFGEMKIRWRNPKQMNPDMMFD